MGKTLCQNGKELSSKVKGKKAKYSCVKCDVTSPKEKWCCKPKKL